MEFDKLVDDCMAFENTISALINSVGNKKLSVRNLEKTLLEYTQSESQRYIEREQEFWKTIEDLKVTKENFDVEIKLYNETNEQLRELVALSQRHVDESKISEVSKSEHFQAANVLQEFEQLKVEYIKIQSDTSMVEDISAQDTLGVEEVVEHSGSLVINLHKNANILRVLEQQLKYAEQQFDIIINQLPWVSLPYTYFQQLRTSFDSRVRELSDVLQLQTNEINDLNESLSTKKERKLALLEELAKELNGFATKRQDAILMTDYHKRDGPSLRK